MLRGENGIAIRGIHDLNHGQRLYSGWKWLPTRALWAFFPTVGSWAPDRTAGGKQPARPLLSQRYSRRAV